MVMIDLSRRGALLLEVMRSRCWLLAASSASSAGCPSSVVPAAARYEPESLHASASKP